ncbi:MAG: ABC transporter permease [Spirochaetales bacterium]|nr:ABC transporter permease [Spirochaetales bacterium]
MGRRAPGGAGDLLLRRRRHPLPLHAARLRGREQHRAELRRKGQPGEARGPAGRGSRGTDPLRTGRGGPRHPGRLPGACWAGAVALRVRREGRSSPGRVPPARLVGAGDALRHGGPEPRGAVPGGRTVHEGCLPGRTEDPGGVRKGWRGAADQGGQVKQLNRRFVIAVALRYFRARRRSGAASTALSILGVAVGVMTLTAVLGVMNGFQLGFIESILEVSSYHLQLEGPEDPEPLLAELRALRNVEAVVPFREEQVIVEGLYEDQRGCLLRRLPEAVESLDPGFRERLEIVEGRFDLAQRRGIVLGSELARHLGVGPGDTVSVIALGGASFASLEPERRTYLVTGLFKSGYYDFDLGWAFASLEDARADAAVAAPGAGAAADRGPALKVGIKIRNRFRDQESLAEIRALVGQRGYAVASWREFNRAFFGALRTEKIMMMVLVGLIFVVVGFNIYHSLRRAIRERYEDIGVLKALGASDLAVQYVFVFEGLLIGLAGGGIGLLLGLLIAVNINWVFAAAERIVNLLAGLFFRLAAPLAGGGGEPFSLFSPAYFYISEIPSRVLFHETLLIVLFAVGSCTLAALFASSRAGSVRPAEVLRYE